MRRASVKDLAGWQKRRRLEVLQKQKEQRSIAREREVKLRRVACGAEASRKEESGPGISLAFTPGTDEVSHQSLSRDADRVQSTASERELETSSSGDPTTSAFGLQFQAPRHLRGRTKRLFYASQIAQPEWLIDTPGDLESDWYVMPRPEGPRCLLITQTAPSYNSNQGGHRSRVCSRLKDGAMHMSFGSWLPAGTVLDAVFSEEAQTFFLLDCMQWDGVDMCKCDFDFRFFWLKGKVADQEASSPIGRPYGVPKLGTKDPGMSILPYAQLASNDALRECYGSQFGFHKDGLLFVHRLFQYSSGPSPLLLQWKDSLSSRFPLTTDAAGKVLERQEVVLQVGADRSTLLTGDRPGIALGRLPPSLSQGPVGSRLFEGAMLRLRLGPGGVFYDGESGKIAGCDLSLEGADVRSSRRRVHADLASKIVFQHLQRSGQVRFNHLFAGAGEATGASLDVQMD